MNSSTTPTFKQLETAAEGSHYSWPGLAAQLKFNEQGLIPAIAQCAQTKRVLMFAWMNNAALEETLSTGQVCYFSRSRNALWRKGETSHHTQHLVSLRIDCDGDCLLLEVEQQGPACHTNRTSCFYHLVQPPQVSISS